MSKRPRSNRTTGLKVKVALEAIKGEQKDTGVDPTASGTPKSDQESCLGSRCHAYSSGEGILLPHGYHGLGQQDGSGMAAVQHPGCLVLHVGD